MCSVLKREGYGEGIVFYVCVCVCVCNWLYFIDYDRVPMARTVSQLILM